MNIQIFSQDEILPPQLKNVTVINDEGDVKVYWELPENINFDLIISRDSFIVGNVVGIKTIIDTSINTWIDKKSNANELPRTYKISYKDVGQEPNQPGQYESNLFNTLHTSITMDTCKKNNDIRWSRYVKSSWKDLNDTISIHYYNIWRSVDGNDTVKIAAISPEDTSFTDRNIEYDRIYKYYIEGVLSFDTTIKSMSNRVYIDTDMPDDPEYINFDRLGTDNGKINMEFSIEENSELVNYVLLRSQTPDGLYDTIKRFETSALNIKYTDNPGNPNKNIWFYHLASENSCGALTTRSDTLSNLLLNVAKENLMNQLDWNELNHINNNANITFNLYRQIGNQERELLNASYEAPYYDNKVQLYEGQGKSAKFCYEIEAEINHEAGYRSTLYSNRNCVYVKPRVFLPNAIIPNDPNNNTFKPEFTFEPDTYLLIVYNRQGVKIFEAKNKGWNGKTRNGKEVKPGTYIYYLEFKIPGEPLIRKRGEVTVVYSR